MIHVDSGLEEGHCGIVPLGGKCNRCTTTGLQWNLGKTRDSRTIVITASRRQPEYGTGRSDQHLQRASKQQGDR